MLKRPHARFKPSTRGARKATATIAAIALAAGSIGLANPAAAADPVSQSTGKFLSGSALGLDLDSLVNLQGANAVNVGAPLTPVTNPLSVAVLQAVNVSLGGGINLLGANSLLSLGAVNQYAAANTDGSSQAASGAVSDQGAIEVGGSAAFPADAELDLTPLLSQSPVLTAALSNASVSTGALSATANQTAAGVQSGDYQIADLSLNLTSPLISGIYTGLRATLATLQPVVNGLPALIRALPGVGPLATITGVPNLVNIVDTALGTVTAPGISANLQTGVVTIDIEALLANLGLDLNNLPAGTQLMPYVTQALTTDLLPAITTALTNLTTQLTNSVNGISVSVLGVPVALAILAPVLNPVIAQLVAPVNTVVAGLGTTVITPLADALTGLVSLQANVQQTGGGIFTERALVLGVLPILGSLATVNLASASVGPNAGPIATLTSLNPDTGPTTGGTGVTVIGTGFTPTSTVIIDGVTVPTTYVSPTEISFTTPPHAAGPVDVVVEGPSGTSAPLPFTYLSVVPTATGITPDSGPVAGGQAVTITGNGFETGATSVTIGGIAVPAAAVTVNSLTSLTFTTPAHAAGPVDVTVTTAGGTSTPPLTYTYLPAPTAASLVPTAGPVAGGQTVTMTGTGFVVGDTTVTIDGTTVAATVASATSLTFVTPAHAAGLVQVTATTPGGTTNPLGYAYVGLPTATSLTPTSGPTAGGTAVTVDGSGFVPGQTSVTVDGVTIPAGSVTVNSPSSLTFSTPAHAAGPVDVTVTTPNGTSTPPLTFTYVAPPTVATIDPDAGPSTGGQEVTITGTNFVSGATSVLIGGNTVPATVISPTELTFITPPHAPGAVTAQVITAGGASALLDYTYYAAPSAGSLTPDSGPVAGGTEVTVAGTGFVPGLTSVTIGGTTIPAGSVTVNSATSLTFTTPANPAGPVDVTVTTPGGTTAPPLTFTYFDVPTATSLDPDSGPVVGGQVVTILGTGFAAGATTVIVDGSPVPAGDVTVISPTELTYETPAHAAGPVPVTVSTPGGTTAPLTYTYVAAPTLTGINPNAGPTAGGQLVTLAGTNFVVGDTIVTIDGIDVPATVNSATSLTFITPPHPAGGVLVTATTPGGTTPSQAYTYYDVPTADTIDPDSGPIAGGQEVTIEGGGFAPGVTTVIVDGTAVPAGDVTVVSPSVLTYITPAHPAGLIEVVVSTPGGTTAPLDYTYLDIPAISALNPDSGPSTGGQTVTITGNDFVDGETTVTIGTVTIPADEVTFISETSISFVTPAQPAGVVEVTTTTAGGTATDPLDYTYYDAPTATDIDPNAGPTTGGQDVTVTGTNFVPGDTTVTIGGTVIPAGSVLVNTPTSLTFTTPAHAAGPVDVVVTTPGGVSDPLDYTYYDAPTATDLDPESGPTAGGQLVTVTGSNFADGVTTVTVDGIDVPAGDVTVVNSTTLTYLSPAHAAGPVDVVISTPGGESEPLTYTYVAPPTSTSLNPEFGPVAGGTEVRIIGTGFVAGDTTVQIDGITVTPTVESATELTFITPAHAAGPVDVTVTTAGGVTDPLTFTYLDAPTATSIDPDSGPSSGGQTVTIVGTGFVDGITSVVIGGIVVPADLVSVESDTELSFLTPAHAAGPVIVTIVTPGGSSDPLGYTYYDAPTATDIDPDAGPVAGGQLVTITGTDFVPGQTSVVIGGNTVAAADVTVIGTTSLTFLTPAHAAGAVTVTVTTPGGTSDELDYTYYDAPTATSIDPDAGPSAGGQDVTIVGTGFVEDLTSVEIGGITVPASEVTVVSATELTFSTPAHPAGAVTVTVTTPGGTSDELDYTYYDAPTADSLDPTTGLDTGGETVTITGTNFVDGLTSVEIGGITVPAADVTVVSPTELTFSTPPHAVGEVEVTVTTPGGTTEPLDFTYYAVPVLSSINPGAGPVAGGQVVTLRGSGFIEGETSVLIDDDVEIGLLAIVVVPADEVTVISPTELRFTTPPHALGPVLVSAQTPFATSNALDYTYYPAPDAASLTPTTGPAAGGQTVTVFGSDFVAGATSVTIGGNTVVAADVLVSSPERLTFVTPAHAVGPVEVTVTTPGGTTAPLDYTYVAAAPGPTPDPPVITDPVDGSETDDTTPPISGTGTPGNTVVVVSGPTVICVTIVAANGTWTCTPTTAFGPGEHSISATQTTPEGFTSGPSEIITFTVTTSAIPINPPLAYTGTPVGTMLGFAGLLLLLGAALLVTTTRRRTTH